VGSRRTVLNPRRRIGPIKHNPDKFVARPFSGTNDSDQRTKRVDRVIDRWLKYGPVVVFPLQTDAETRSDRVEFFGTATKL